MLTLRSISFFKKAPWTLLISGLLLYSQQSLSAACCGGGSGGSTFLSSAQNSLFLADYSYNQIVIGSVNNDGLWRKSPEPQKVSTLSLGAAYLLSDLWQATFNIPIVTRELGHEKFQNVGDTNFSIAYEFLPDWDYHPLRPRGLIYGGITAPTGKSPQVSNNGGLDSSGRGFWDLQMGVLLTKLIRSWDFSTNFQIHQSLTREFQTPTSSGTEPQKITSRPGTKLSLSSGYSLQDHRVGLSVTDVSEGSQTVESPRSQVDTGVERFTIFTLTYTYNFSDTNLMSVSYIDQTLLGDPRNTSLGQGASISYQQSWNR